jgi:branched-chain amino acid transport system substrate-binding protein
MYRGAIMLAVALLLAGNAEAAEKVKIGFIATMSGPGGVLGQELLDGFNLGIQHRGGKLGGLPVELVIGDDQLKPDVGKQLADKMLQKDEVDIVTGIVFSNVMMAIAKPIADAEVFIVSANSGPSPLAGKLCNPYFFNVAWQNDNTHEAMGEYVQSKGHSNVYLLAPDYQAGKDALAGFKRFYKGNIAGEVYTTVNQPDYAAELAALRAAKPDAVYAFYPGGMAVNFVKQYAQAGLKDVAPLYGPSFMLDQTVLKAQGDAALGLYNTSFWSATLDNDANKRFVADFEKTYGRLPAPYAAQAYDAALLIDSAIAAVGGKIEDKEAFRAALRAADFKSVRGPFKFNKNHFPIQNYYLEQVVKDPQGRLVNAFKGVVFENHADAYQPECPMTW